MFKLASKVVAISSALTLVGIGSAWVVNLNGTGYIGIHEAAMALGVPTVDLRTLVSDIQAHNKPASDFDVLLERKAQFMIPCVPDGGSPTDITWYKRTGVYKTGLNWVPVTNDQGVLSWIRLTGTADGGNGFSDGNLVAGNVTCPGNMHRAKFSIAKPQLVKVMSESLTVNNVLLPTDTQLP